jgi:hypothetical protein
MPKTATVFFAQAAHFLQTAPSDAAQARHHPMRRRDYFCDQKNISVPEKDAMRDRGEHEARDSCDQFCWAFHALLRNKMKRGGRAVP